MLKISCNSPFFSEQICYADTYTEQDGLYMCCTKSSSNAPMLFFCLFLMLHMCVVLMGFDQEDGFKDSEGRSGANIMKDTAVDLQHWTRVDGNLL
jgi:hypothetical protein